MISVLSQTNCDLDQAGELVSESAVLAILKNPLAHDRIDGGKYRISIAGEASHVRAQDFTNFQIGTVRGPAQLGDMKLYLLLP